MKTILRLTTTALLAAALFTTACSDEGGPKDWSVATLESQTVTLVLEPRLAATILGILGGTLGGERVLKGRSFSGPGGPGGC